MNFFLWHEGAEHGPYDLLTIQEHLGAGKLSPKMLARFETESKWKPLESLLPKPQKPPTLKRERMVTPRSKPSRRTMAMMVAAIVILATGLLFVFDRFPGLPRRSAVHGEVFMTSRDGGAIRQPSVLVSIYDQEKVLAHLRLRLAASEEEQKKAIEAIEDEAKNEFRANSEKYGASTAAEFLRLKYASVVFPVVMNFWTEAFKSLPPPIKETQTDAGGAYSVSLPKRGKFTLVAIGGGPSSSSKYGAAGNIWLKNFAPSELLDAQLPVSDESLIIGISQNGELRGSSVEGLIPK